MLTPRQDQIMNFILKNPNCTSGDIATALGIRREGVRRHLRRLIITHSRYLSTIPGDSKDGRPCHIYRIYGIKN